MTENNSEKWPINIEEIKSFLEKAGYEKLDACNHNNSERNINCIHYTKGKEGIIAFVSKSSNPEKGESKLERRLFRYGEGFKIEDLYKENFHLPCNILPCGVIAEERNLQIPNQFLKEMRLAELKDLGKN